MTTASELFDVIFCDAHKKWIVWWNVSISLSFTVWSNCTQNLEASEQIWKNYILLVEEAENVLPTWFIWFILNIFDKIVCFQCNKYFYYSNTASIWLITSIIILGMTCFLSECRAYLQSASLLESVVVAWSLFQFRSIQFCWGTTYLHVHVCMGGCIYLYHDINIFFCTYQVSCIFNKGDDISYAASFHDSLIFLLLLKWLKKLLVV
jgi:hypothetical protein